MYTVPPKSVHRQHTLECMESWIALKQMKKTASEYITIITPLYVVRKTRKQENALRQGAVHTQPSTKHKSALHFAIRCGMPYEVIAFMLIRCKLELSYPRDHDGKTPLHYAAIHADASVIELVGAWKPQCALMHDLEGLTPLHHAINKNRKSGIIFAVTKVDRLSVKECVSKTTQKRGINTGVDKIGCTPLHLAMLANSDFKVVEFLFGIFPCAAVVCNQDGDLPIHVALQTHCNQQIIDLVTAGCTETCAQSLLTKNSADYIALEHAMHVAVPIEICTMLIHRTKDCIGKFSQLANTDALSACLDDTVDKNTLSFSMAQKIKIAMYMIKYNVEVNTMDLYMAEFPNDGIIILQQRRCTLLHYAATMKVSLSVMDKIYRNMPVECHRQCDSDGNSPLHYLLYNRYVAALLDTSIFPEIAMASQFLPMPMKTQRQDVMQYLLQDSVHRKCVEYFIDKWPESVSLRNTNQQTVLDMAMFSYCPLSVVSLLHKKDKTLVKHIGFGGNSVLHNICARINTEHVMKTCNRKHRCGILFDTKQDSFLDNLCFESTDRLEIFSWANSLCENRVHCTNDKGQLPLHVAIDNHAEHSIVQKLVHHYTQHTLLLADAAGNTAAHLLMRWEMAACYIKDETLRHITAKHVYSGNYLLARLHEMIVGVCSDAVMIKRDLIFVRATLRKTCFVADIVKVVLAECNTVDILNPVHGIFQSLDALVNIITHPDRMIYMEYYSAIIFAAFNAIVMSSRHRTLPVLRFFELEYSKQLARFAVGNTQDGTVFAAMKQLQVVLSGEIETMQAESTLEDVANKNADELIIQEQQSLVSGSPSKSRRNRMQKNRPRLLGVDAVFVTDGGTNSASPTDATHTSCVPSEESIHDKIKRMELENQTLSMRLDNMTAVGSYHVLAHTTLTQQHESLKVLMLRDNDEHKQTTETLRTAMLDASMREKDHASVVLQLQTANMQIVDSERRHTATQEKLDDALLLPTQHTQDFINTKKLLEELVVSAEKRDREHAAVVQRLEQTVSEWFIRSTYGKVRETSHTLPKCSFCTAYAVFCEHGTHTCIDCINILYTHEPI